jgi:hypothetical protein
MLTPVSPGYNPERLDDQLRFPMPAVPHLAMANERWKVAHSAQSAQRSLMERDAMSRTLARDTA